jgi:hypothetical protein
VKGLYAGRDLLPYSAAHTRAYHVVGPKSRGYMSEFRLLHFGFTRLLCGAIEMTCIF